MWAGELLLLVVLVAVVTWAMRGGKPARLDSPLVIDRPGQLHVTLAPQLDHAQAFIESIAERCNRAGNPDGDVATQFFVAHGTAVGPESDYLLAASWRSGVWYFQAIMPPLHERESSLKTMREFSAAVLVQHPPLEPLDDRYVQNLRDAVGQAAALFNVSVRGLH